MIKHLSSIITRIKDFCYNQTIIYALMMGAIAAALLFAWVLSDGESVAFVYNEF